MSNIQLLWNNVFIHYEYVLLSLTKTELTAYSYAGFSGLRRRRMEYQEWPGDADEAEDEHTLLR